MSKINLNKNLSGYLYYVLATIFITLIAIIPTLVNKIKPNWYEQNWGTVDYGISLLGVIGIIFLFEQMWDQGRERKSNERREKEQIILNIKQQLQIIKEFAGNPYNMSNQEWVDENRYRGNPFQDVFPIPYKPIGVIEHPGYLKIESETLKCINYVNLWVSNFNAALENIKTFKSTIPPSTAISIHLKVHKVLKKDMTHEEDLIYRKLIESYGTLHTKIIGDANTKTLHYWVKRLESQLDKY